MLKGKFGRGGGPNPRGGGGPYPLADLDRGSPNPRGVQIRCDTGRHLDIS